MREFVIELRPFNSELLQAVNVFFYEDVGRIPGKFFVAMSPGDAIQIKRRINKEILLISRDQIPQDPYSPFPEVTIDMFTSKTDSTFELRKLRCLSEISARIGYELTIISAIELLEFFVIITSFAEKGIVINDTNREEKYLEIVSSSDEHLINLLEKYLEIKDKIDKIYTRYNELVFSKNSIVQARNDDELNTALKTINPNRPPRVSEILHGEI
jgi:hypothetical protein